MLIGLFGLVVFQGAQQLFFENFEACRFEFKVEQLIENFFQQDLLFVAVATDGQL